MVMWNKFCIHETKEGCQGKIGMEMGAVNLKTLIHVLGFIGVWVFELLT